MEDLKYRTSPVHKYLVINWGPEYNLTFKDIQWNNINFGYI